MSEEHTTPSTHTDTHTDAHEGHATERVQMSHDAASSGSPATSTIPHTTPAKKSPHFLTEIIKLILFVVLIVVPIRVYIAQPFLVEGESMASTFSDGDYLIIDELSYRFNEPQRGDVIVFRFPGNNRTFFIKRIIALPSETITLADSTVTIKNEDNPNGFLLNEPYLDERFPYTHGAVTALGEDEYFVMGDNRDESFDSRTWGALPREAITGRAVLRLLPPSAIALFPGAIESGVPVDVTQ